MSDYGLTLLKVVQVVRQVVNMPKFGQTIMNLLVIPNIKYSLSSWLFPFPVSGPLKEAVFTHGGLWRPNERPGIESCQQHTRPDTHSTTVYLQQWAPDFVLGPRLKVLRIYSRLRAEVTRGGAQSNQGQNQIGYMQGPRAPTQLLLLWGIIFR